MDAGLDVYPGYLSTEKLMRVYLDDERATPDGWTRTHTARETIDLLKSGQVKELSLDHDLGEGWVCGNGYDVLLWIESQVVLNGFIPPAVIKVHSANSGARTKMELAIQAIKRLAKTNGTGTLDD